MATKIVTKNSSTASAVPTTSDLVQGELAVNVADKKLFTEDNSGAIIELADGVKLAGIEASADVTDTANVTAAGAVMDSELTSEASVKALNQGVATTDSPAFAGLTVDTDTLAVDATNNRVGIGTSSPSKKLHISTTSDSDLGTVALGIGGPNLANARGAHITKDTSSPWDFTIQCSGSASANTATIFKSSDAVETMRIDSSGNVGIGTTSPAGPLQVYGSDYVYISPNVANKTPNSTQAGIALGWNKSSGQGESIIAYNKGAGSPGGLVFADYSGTYAERMRLDGSGRLIIASAGGSDTGYIRVPVAGSTLGAWTSYAGTASTRIHMRFQSSSGLAGYISTTGLTAFYGTSSDYRLKTDAQPMTGATARLKALKPVNFEWIADGTRVDGFLAHEAQAVVPECVTGEKDAMMEEEYEVSPAVLDEEGNTVEEAVMGTRSVPEYQGIDQSKLVPLLVATIQELEARITQLENN
jgi:hypothetical protein